MSGKNQPTSITQKKNLKTCPEKLEVIISKLNLIPPNANLWELNIKSNELIFNNRFHLEALQDLKDKIEDYSADFQRFIYGREVDLENPSFFFYSFLPDLNYYETCDALIRYEEFNKNRHLLKGLIKYFLSSGKNFSGQMPYLLQPKTRVKIDETGRIQFSFDELIEALQNVEISRLRICENCSKIFWQGRNDQKGCDAKCASNIRVKKSRELKRKNGVEYKFNSIKKELKKNK